MKKNQVTTDLGEADKFNLSVHVVPKNSIRGSHGSEKLGIYFGSLNLGNSLEFSVKSLNPHDGLHSTNICTYADQFYFFQSGPLCHRQYQLLYLSKEGPSAPWLILIFVVLLSISTITYLISMGPAIETGFL